MAKKLAALDVNKCIGCMECMFACSRRVGRGGVDKSAINVRSAGGVERGFVIVVCRACQQPPCAKVCPTDALIEREGGGIILNDEACIGCGFCAEACILGAIPWDSERNKPIVCKYCGHCANYCAHDAIGLVELKAEAWGVQQEG
jgi:Fe-S-cluster-containing dehydrogenase component